MQGKMRWGYIDQAGEIRIVPRYDWAGRFDADGIAYAVLDGEGTYIDKTGNELFKRRFDVGREFSEGRAAVRCGKKWGYIDAAGREAVPCVFDAAKSFAEGRAAVKRRDGYGFIDIEGNWITPPVYRTASAFSEGRAAVWEKGRRPGYIDSSGSVVIEQRYRCATAFAEGVAYVEDDFFMGYIDREGRHAIVADGWQGGGEFSEGGLAGVRFVNQPRPYGLIDSCGDVRISPCLDMVGRFRSRVAPAMLDKQWGVIDTEGRWICSPHFDFMLPMCEGLFRAQYCGKTGYVDQDGNVVIGFDYAHGSSFSEGLAAAALEVEPD